ncbi:threo-3-hydroxy-L-aspartate ammonia-lyase [Leptothermofonsia sichuanensis E412]|uniref:threo-3-hydroxy-L-aspartate ammonia-lyase n=1 Tax=Leptothermofonsia sichuanensis TaxID=2917832 RepID=UPI001CA684F9|nr:threo-3-hydroxy-L-aspartate ammonia-lyase [Leptothermofonsia sichuanensis]QZZ19618.1 threo-3-hydroxy-L-aspartate ammonia-lyase [Leptothermofonsia sichuanensis E412]
MKDGFEPAPDGAEVSEATDVTYSDIEAAAQRLHEQAHRTPVMTSTTVNQITGSQVFFKCENFQRTGSFKFRGAYNALAQLCADQRQRGVLAYSSGNHAQAIALAGQLLHIPTAIVMPEDAPAVKLAATRGYGAEVILYNRQLQSREVLGQTLAQERGLTLIPPYDHPQVIAGQGTVAQELIAEVGELDLLLVCCGGGGLLSGCAISARTLAPACQVIGVEPKRADDATRSFHSRSLQTVHNPDTIADGARTPALGKYTFPLVLEYVNDMVTVSEIAILRTMFFLWERLKIVVEPTGALAAAALLEGVISAPHARIGVVISGGNVDLKQAGKLFARVNKPSKPKPPMPWARELS